MAPWLLVPVFDCIWSRGLRGAVRNGSIYSQEEVDFGVTIGCLQRGWAVGGDLDWHCVIATYSEAAGMGGVFPFQVAMILK